MISVKVRNKTDKEVEQFLEKNKKVYPKQLAEFLGISDRHARRIFEMIREKYSITEKYIESQFLEEYLDR